MTEKCYLCHSNAVRQIFSSSEVHGKHKINARKHNLFSCLSCGVIFVKRSNTNANSEKYYDTGYFFPKHDRFHLLVNLFIKITENFSFKKKEKYILKYFKNEIKIRRISILDVGCGSGNFLRKISSKFFDKTGFDIKNFVDKYDFDFCSGNFLKTKFRKKFDVICLWHVLEHLAKPYEYLNKIKKLLQKDGIIIISTPNTESLGFKFGQENWFHLDTPRHLFLYNKASLTYLLTQTGLAVTEIKSEQYDYYTDLFWSVRKSKLKYLIYFLYPLIKLFSNETLTVICKIQ